MNISPTPLRSAIALGFAASTLTASSDASIVEQFLFNDAAGTGMANTANTGLNGTSWNFNLNGQPGEGATDGTGIFVIGQDATAGTSAISSDYTRKVEMQANSGATYDSGVLTLTHRFDSWDYTGLYGSAGVDLRLNDADGGNITAVLNMQGNEAAVRVRAAATGAGSSGSGQQGGLAFASSEGIIIRNIVDLDAGVWSVDYRFDTDLAFTNVSSGLTPTGFAVDEIVMIIDGTNGTATWGSTNFANVDYIQLDYAPIPEPASLGLLAVGGVCLLGRRRRR